MLAYEIIMKKRDGHTLSTEEINFFISGFTNGQIADYQMSALAMAVYFNGMEPRELADWTLAMVNSGDCVDLSGIPGVKTDKHSTGGVGDKTTIVLAPWLAAAGVPLAKMSGRGLGHTGGTIDKLESIPGFRTDLSVQEVIDNVNKIGVAVAGQTANLVPADKKLYGLRDVTATVDSIPLIASSVMSKKIAAGADAILLDVKVGSGAFMKTVEDAKALSHAMVSIGTQVGRKTAAVISGMDQPLGYAVGNSLEIIEAIEALKGGGPDDLQELVLTLGSHLLILAGKAQTEAESRAILLKALHSGKALAKFKEMVARQGGDPRVAEDYTLLPQAAYVMDIPATGSGYVAGIEGQSVGLAVKVIGAGREKADDTLDLSAGTVLVKKLGDAVSAGETIARLYGNDEDKMRDALRRIQEAYTYAPEKPAAIPMVYAVVTE